MSVVHCEGGRNEEVGDKLSLGEGEEKLYKRIDI